MSFFFEENGVAEVVDTIGDLAKSQQCLVCPRNRITIREVCKHHKMEAVGSETPEIYFLGSHPNKNEDTFGRPFASNDDSAKALHDELDRSFKEFYVKEEWKFSKTTPYKSLVRFNNLLRCHDVSVPDDMTLNCCRGFLEADILKIKPRIIVGFGETVLKAMVGVSGIADWRGRKVPIRIGDHTCWYFAFESLEDIVGKRKNDNPKYVSTWEEVFRYDLRSLKRLVLSKQKPDIVPPEEYKKNIEYVLGNNQKDLVKIKSWLEELKKLPKVGLDFETNALRIWQLEPKPKVVSVAIGTSDKVYAFPVEHRNAWNGQYTEIRNLLTDFLLTYKGVKVCHNDKCEKMWSYQLCGPKVLFDTKWGCTMTRAFLLDERTTKSHQGPLSLNLLSLLYFGFKLKDQSNVDVTKTEEANMVDLLTYNAMDTKYTFILDELLEKQFDTTLDWIYSHKLFIAKTLVLTEDKGFPVDKSKVELFSTKLGDEIKNLDVSISNEPNVKEFERLHETFNPNSSKHLVTIFRDILKLESVKQTKGAKEGSFSTDKDVMDIYAAKGIKLAELIKTNREISKLKSTYIDSVPKMIVFDGKIHTNFNHLFTNTGRLSSEHPNLQNFPARKNSYVREIISAPPGYQMVSCDYGQIEAKVIAMISKDPRIIKYVWDGFDFHGDWATRAAKKNSNYAGCESFGEFLANSKKRKAYRARVKNLLVFPWFYGAGTKSVGKSLGFSESDVKDLYKDFWDLFGGIKKWQYSVIEKYESLGYVKTLTGQRRHGPLSYNEKINMGVQGSASDIVTNAMNRLSEEAFRLNKPQYQIVLNIHDDLTFFMPEESLDEDIAFVAKHMCCLPFDFVNVPITIEVKTGPNWGQMKELIVFETTDFFPEWKGGAIKPEQLVGV